MKNLIYTPSGTFKRGFYSVIYNLSQNKRELFFLGDSFVVAGDSIDPFKGVYIHLETEPKNSILFNNSI